MKRRSDQPTLIACVPALWLTGLLAQNLHLQPGVAGLSMETGLVNHSQTNNVTTDDLLTMPNPVDHYDSKYDEVRILSVVGSHRLQEGEIVSTTAWLHFVALEDDSKSHRAGDYHIRVRRSAE